MKCLILAAGKGSRLAARGDSKPLVSFLGLSLIERTILTAQSCGLTEFYVVTGYNGHKVRGFLDKFSQEKNLNITNQKLELDCQITISVRKKEADKIASIFDSIYEVNIKELED